MIRRRSGQPPHQLGSSDRNLLPHSGLLIRPVGRTAYHRPSWWGGQSTIEYALLVILAISALVSIFGYVRNALSHQMKSGVDGMGHGMRYPFF